MESVALPSGRVWRAAGRSSRVAAGHPAAPTALVLGTVATCAAALAVDVLAGEHPTHTLALVLMTAAIASVSEWIAPRYRRLPSLLHAAVVTQPALHLAGKWVGASPGDHHATPGGTLHYLLPDTATWSQIAATVLIVAVVVSCGVVTDLLVAFAQARVSRRARGSGPVLDVAPQLIRVGWRGSMVRWCGWRLRAARRGPPCPALLPAT